MSQDLAAAPTHNPSIGRMTFAVFLISVLGLFLELLLIRWVSTEIRIFAYLQNTSSWSASSASAWAAGTAASRSPCRDILVPLGPRRRSPVDPDSAGMHSARITLMFNGFSDLLVWDHSDNDRLGARSSTPALGLVLTLGLMVLLWEIVRAGRPAARPAARRTTRTRSRRTRSTSPAAWSASGCSSRAAPSNLPPVAWFAVFAAVAPPFRRDRRPVEGLGTSACSRPSSAFASSASRDPGWLGDALVAVPEAVGRARAERSATRVTGERAG